MSESTAKKAKLNDVFLEAGSDRDVRQVGKDYMNLQSGVDDIKGKWYMVLTHAEIQCGVDYIASELNARFAGEKIVLCGILKGAYMFLADLTKRLTIPYSVYFVEASSYGDNQVATDNVQLMSQLVPSKFAGRKCVLLDELYDHGQTLNSIRTHLLKSPLSLSPADIFTVTLFSKDRPTVHPLPDLVALTKLPQVWLVGYGLDDQGTKRGWPHLWACPKIEGVEKVRADEAFGWEQGGEALKAYEEVRQTMKARVEELKKSIKGVVGSDHIGV